VPIDPRLGTELPINLLPYPNAIKARRSAVFDDREAMQVPGLTGQSQIKFTPSLSNGQSVRPRDFPQLLIF
jgi:hypothetical protein